MWRMWVVPTRQGQYPSASPEMGEEDTKFNCIGWNYFIIMLY